MKFIVILLALAVVPIVIGFFQTKHYNSKLKPSLDAEATSLMEDAGVDNPSVDFDYLHANLSGITLTEGDREKVRKQVDALGKKAVIAHADDLQTYGFLKLDKVGNKLTVYGDYTKGTWETLQSALNVDGVESVEKGPSQKDPEHGKHYQEKDFFINPTLTEMIPGNQKWVNDFLSLPGDRSIEVNAHGNKVCLVGDVTERIKKRVLDGALSNGLAIHEESQLNIIDPKPATLNTSLVDGGVLASGTVPDDYDITGFGFKDSDNVTHDPFTDAPEGAYSDKGFLVWHKDYYSNPTLKRGYSLNGKNLALSGDATTGLYNDWQSRLKKLGLKPSKRELKMYASTFHFPGYKPTSQISDGDFKKLTDAFKLNLIFFDSGSDVVDEEGLAKVENLANTIKSVDPGIKFIIGGHASPSGNAELNRKLSAARANSVVAALVEQGVSKDRFTITSFGSGEAKKGGDQREDRKVEILVK